MAPRPAAPINPWADLWNMYQGHPAEYFRTHPYKALVRGAAEIPSEVQRIATATPGALRALGQLQMGQRMAPAGPARALQYVLQQADPTTRRTPQQTAHFHGSDFAAIPGAVGSYVQHQLLDPQRLNQRVATEPISTAADLSAVLGAPEDAAKMVSRIARGTAARLPGDAATRALMAAAKSPVVAAPRAVTKAAARVGDVINPANVAVRGAGAIGRGYKGTAGMFDASGAMTPKGVAAFQKTGEAAMPGKLTAADYADPHVQQQFAPIFAKKGFNAPAFKEGVLSYNGAPTVRSQVTGITPRAAAQPKTADLISQGRDAIDARVTSFAPGATGQTADQIRGFANSKSAPNFGYTPTDLTDLRLAAAGHDVLDAATAAKDPTLLSQIGPPLARKAWQLGTTGVSGLAAAGLTAAATGGHSMLPGIADWAPEAISGVLGGAGSLLLGGHKVGQGEIANAIGKGQDWAAIRGAGAGAPNWLDVPAWTKAAAAPAAAAPYVAPLGRMDLGTPPAAAPGGGGAGGGLEAPPPGGWQAPPEVKEPDLDQEDAGGASAPEAAQAPASEAAPEPAKGGHAKAWSPPASDKPLTGYTAPPEVKEPDLDAAPAAQADGGRVGYAEGGEVVDMSNALLRRAEAHHKAAQASTKPMLGLSDDVVAKALKVAQAAL